MSANEMPERIWAAPWHSRSDADAGIWQSNDPGNEVYALEYLRKDLCAPFQRLPSVSVAEDALCSLKGEDE